MQNAGRLRGIHEMKTLQSSKKRSLPKVQTSSYLDLYVFERERERLEKEAARLQMRNKQVEMRLEEINKNMQNLWKDSEKGNSCPKPKDAGLKKEKPKDWKKMSLNY